MRRDRLRLRTEIRVVVDGAVVPRRKRIKDDEQQRRGEDDARAATDAGPAQDIRTGIDDRLPADFARPRMSEICARIPAPPGAQRLAPFHGIRPFWSYGLIDGPNRETLNPGGVVTALRCQ